jgi:hypothetical protein
MPINAISRIGQRHQSCFGNLRQIVDRPSSENSAPICVGGNQHCNFFFHKTPIDEYLSFRSSHDRESNPSAPKLRVMAICEVFYRENS